MIKTLLAFIYFQNDEASLSRHEAISTLRFAKTRQINIGPFAHLLNFMVVNDPEFYLQGGQEKKLNVLENKFSDAATNWKSNFLEINQGMFFMDSLKKKL